MLTRQRLRQLFEPAAAARIAVVGDFFLDKYLEVDPALEEPSVETGKVAHQVVAVRSSPGAAGTVVSNLAALGAGELHAIGMTGEDGEGFELRRGLERLGCSTRHLHAYCQRHTPTYLKPRDGATSGLSGEHSRYDTKNRQATPADIQDRVMQSLESLVARLDAVIVLDQVESADCGVVTGAVRQRIAELADAHPEVVFWADSRRRIHDFRNVITKPNQFEAIGLDHPTPADLVAEERLLAAGRALRKQTGKPVFITCGSRGILVSDPDWTLVPACQVTGETDPTGAGDSTTAGCVLALCGGASCVEAAMAGNLVAAVTVQRLATTGTASQQDLERQLSSV